LPARFREAAIAAGWTVRDVPHEQVSPRYVALLER